MRPMRQPCSVAPRQVDKVFLSTSSSFSEFDAESEPLGGNGNDSA